MLSLQEYKKSILPDDKLHNEVESSFKKYKTDRKKFQPRSSSEMWSTFCKCSYTFSSVLTIRLRKALEQHNKKRKFWKSAFSPFQCYLPFQKKKDRSIYATFCYIQFVICKISAVNLEESKIYLLVQTRPIIYLSIKLHTCNAEQSLYKSINKIKLVCSHTLVRSTATLLSAFP